MYKEIKRNEGQIIIDDTNYFYKRNDAYVEVLGGKIADLFNLKHVYYKPIEVDNKNYYLSKDLNTIGDFTTALDMGIESHNLDDIRDFILINYPEDFDRLMDDIMKMYFMDLLTLNIDRRNDNWGILIKDNKPSIYLLDNDLCFIHNDSVMTSLKDNANRDSLLEIENIYDNFPFEYINMFDNMYALLDNQKLQELIIETEDDIGKELPYKEDYLKRFDLLRYHTKKIKQRDKKRLIR